MFSQGRPQRGERFSDNFQQPLLSLEQLENRCLLALAWQPYFNGPELYVTLDAADDVASFQYLDAQTARLTVNGLAYDYNRNDIVAFNMDTGEGDDQVTIASDILVDIVIIGGKGNDLLIGGSGVDVLLGSEGNDTLIGNAGNDVLDGMDLGSCVVGPNESQICGPGFSTAEADSIVGGDGDDSIWGDAGTDTIDGGAGTNQITLSNYSDCVSVLTADDPSQPQESGPDNIFFEFVNATTARLTVNGSSFDFPRDKVTCFEAETGAGNDHVEVAASVDVPATLLGGDGKDTLLGGTGNESLDGGDGDDSILGNDGNDTLVGGNGNNYLDGGNGNDSILGGPGDDTLADGMGDDTLDGGGGNDVYIQSPGSDDVIRDSDGIDTVNFSRAARAIRFDLGRNAGEKQAVDANRNTVALNGTFENLVGSRFADDLVGDARPNRIDGGGGDRTPHGGSGDATDRRAGAGCDGDTLLGGAGHDWLDGGRGSDLLDGGSGNDVLVGDPARDQLNGGSGNNRNSRVTKSSGSCDGAIRAAFSLPTLNFDAATGTLVVTGDQTGPTDDQIALGLSAQGFVTVTINDASHSSDPDSASYDPRLDGATAVTVLAIQVQGLDGDDILSVGDGFTAAGGQIVLLGGAGDDRLQGGPQGELLVGGSGDDALIGGGGNDTLAGNAGNDQMDGGVGADTAEFSGSTGGMRVNLLFGTARGQGDDLLAAIENVIGSGLADLLIGDDLANQLLGGDGNDTIRGGDGDDTLIGDAGNDRLLGDAGNDSLDGGTGSNKLRPGPDQPTVLAIANARRFEASEWPNQLHDELESTHLPTLSRRRR